MIALPRNALSNVFHQIVCVFNRVLRQAEVLLPMGYRNLKECVDDLARTKQLVCLDEEIDPYLEAAEIQRRLYRSGGPAVYFARVKGCSFPMVGNLFGTLERSRFLFRDTLDNIRLLARFGSAPQEIWKHPVRNAKLLGVLRRMLPKKVSHGPVLTNRIAIEKLPQLVSWPRDGGAFITLPQVYTEHPDKPGLWNSNLGMYRVQLSGGNYQRNKQVGLHYQIHRSIGIHHAAAIARDEPLRVNIFVGGPPAMTLAAIMPLPESVPELAFAGALGGRRVRMVERPGRLPVAADADFCITGTIDPQRLLPEGPFGDHLGYYSLEHDFPVVNVERVTHRPGAIWPFTSVGRPPQEDTSFGELIHEITGPAIPVVIPGVHAVHAVDAAGVHPLLLAIGSERYVPFAKQRHPQELLTLANAILGQGQLSLAKYLLIVAREDQPELDIHDIPAFLQHLLERIDWQTDLHFQTQTTLDTLDYSGHGLNAGSKVVMAAAGTPRRQLPAELPGELSLPPGLRNPRVCLPGVLAIEGPRMALTFGTVDDALPTLLEQLNCNHPLNQFPLIVVVDDSKFAAANLNNFLWTTFTRSNPASDIHGIEAYIKQKHWGCRGSLVIDARVKPNHAPPLLEDPDVTRRVDQLAKQGGPLHGLVD